MSDTALAMSEENVEIVRRMYDKWTRDPSDPPLEFFDAEVEWETHWPGLHNVYRGHEGVREWTRQVIEPMEMELDLLNARTVDAEQVFVEYHARGTGRKSGVDVEMDIFDVLRIRDGLILHRRTFYDRSEALEAAGLSE